jgi:hypothetical protein
MIICVDTGTEAHLYKSTDFIDFILEIDKQVLLVRQDCNKLWSPLGVSFDHPPAQSFRKIASQFSSILVIRILNTIHMQRIHLHDMAASHVKLILESPEVKESRTLTEKWVDFQRNIVEIVRSEAELLLSALPFYIPPGDTPLSLTGVFPLIWPLSAIAASPHVAPSQLSSAKEALFQIGLRAMIPIAAKLANARFRSYEEVSEEAHILHLAWHL